MGNASLLFFSYLQLVHINNNISELLLKIVILTEIFKKGPIFILNNFICQQSLYSVLYNKC